MIPSQGIDGGSTPLTRLVAFAEVAQWQSNSFVKSRSWVQIPPSAQNKIKSCFGLFYFVKM